LALEGPTIACHSCKVIRLGSPAPSPAALTEAIAARLPLAAALTWRLAGPPEAAYWHPDPTFDLHAHIAQLACVIRLDDAALDREVARLFLQRPDRDRPLWRIDLVGPLADGDTVLVWKFHHARARPGRPGPITAHRPGPAGPPGDVAAGVPAHGSQAR
jgi:diacylglycerol O-acyltransferase